ncbi:MAG: PEGA domain-containing protein, partial [Proteobacteria bacterium]|nr:PEGA domain-containing protein [Pseudomonadota bacterium]
PDAADPVADSAPVADANPVVDAAPVVDANPNVTNVGATDEPAVAVADPAVDPASVWGAVPEADPKPSTAKVAISSKPANGAKIKINGTDKGATPLNLELEPGSYKVEAKLAGHKPISKTVNVSGTSMDVPLTFEALPKPEPTPEPDPALATARSGTVMVFFSGRVGDSLLIDGKEVGQIPARITMTEGEHAFAVDGVAGRFAVTRTVKLQNDGTTLIHLDR